MKFASLFRSPSSGYIWETTYANISSNKENNLPLEENKHVDENELATGKEWKLPYKRLR